MALYLLYCTNTLCATDAMHTEIRSLRDELRPLAEAVARHDERLRFVQKVGGLFAAAVTAVLGGLVKAKGGG